MHHLCSSPQVGSRDFKRDDVHALPDAVDVACVGGVPERCGMALVGLGSKKELKGDIGGRGRMVEKGVRLVVWADVGPQLAHLLCYRRSTGVQAIQ